MIAFFRRPDKTGRIQAICRNLIPPVEGFIERRCLDTSRWRDAAAKSPPSFPAGANPTVDFLLHHPAQFVKKTRVKTHDRTASDAA
jgi:hypothetical protein